MDSDGKRDLLNMLYDVARLIRLEAERRARARGMTLTQWRLLRQIESTPGLSQKEAADLLEVEPISVARLVDRLAGNGLVERRPDAEDRRVWRLHLLPDSAAALQRLDVQSIELAEAMSRGIGPEQRRVISEGLQRMRSNLAQSAVEIEQGEDV